MQVHKGRIRDSLLVATFHGERLNSTQVHEGRVRDPLVPNHVHSVQPCTRIAYPRLLQATSCLRWLRPKPVSPAIQTHIQSAGLGVPPPMPHLPLSTLTRYIDPPHLATAPSLTVILANIPCRLDFGHYHIFVPSPVPENIRFGRKYLREDPTERLRTPHS